MSTSNPTSSQAAAPASRTAAGILLRFVAVTRRVKYTTFAVGEAATYPRTPCIVCCISTHPSTEIVDHLLELSIFTRELFNARQQFLVGVDQFCIIVCELGEDCLVIGVSSSKIFKKPSISDMPPPY